MPEIRSRTVLVSGTFAANAIIHLTVHSQERNYTVRTDSQGHWSQEISLEGLGSGSHTITGHTDYSPQEVELAHFSYSPELRGIWYAFIALCAFGVGTHIAVWRRNKTKAE